MADFHLEHETDVKMVKRLISIVGVHRSRVSLLMDFADHCLTKVSDRKLLNEAQRRRIKNLIVEAAQED